MTHDNLRTGGVACDNMLCRWRFASAFASCKKPTPDPAHPLTIAAREQEGATKDVRPQTQKHDPDPLLALVRTAYKRVYKRESAQYITLPFTQKEAERFRELVRDGGEA